MNRRIFSACSAISVAIVLAVAPATLTADELATARELYASAAYEEALAALNRARAAGVTPADAFAVEQYRAFCLLALGRGPEAEAVIEAMVAANPLYLPSSEMSPRVRTAFSDVRRRLLPVIIPQQYAHAKAAFDRKDYVAASAGFAQVLKVLADPDVRHVAAQPPLADLRTLASGFGELSARAVPPPPVPVSAPVVVAVPPAPARPGPTRIYNTSDEGVVAPIAVRQDLPAYPGRLPTPVTGALEVIINEQGFVETATIRASITSPYDRTVLDAAQTWRYRPAMYAGVPVKFRKLIQITVK
jgi:TonB family protein